VGQWCAYPNYDIIKKFTGFMRPGNYEIFRDSAEAHGVLKQDKNFAWASGRFQLECYKEEIEANLRTPGLEGFQLLDLHDYVGQGTALVGLLDTFWQNKGYVTPEEFREFCSPVVPLARLTNRVFTTADKLEAPVEVANYGKSPLTNAVGDWQILDSSGKAVAHGTWPAKTIPLGENFTLGQVTADLSSLPAPGQYKLAVHIRRTGVTPVSNSSDKNGDGRDAYPTAANDWNFWLYPAKISEAIPPGVLIASSWDTAEKHLAAGGKVLFLPRNSDLYWNCPPLARVPIFWNRLMNPAWSRMLGLWCDTNSPALAEFPTDANCDWQWTTLLHNTRAVNLDHLPRGLQPIVQAIDDWNRNWKLGLIFEAKVGQGRLMVCSIDLNPKTNPVAQQLRRTLLDYMASAKFQPQTEISPADFLSLHFNSLIMHDLGAAARA
ncbi:MAG TPA: glycoside hydrolase, partial [Verrucomicrobiae bacterium]|nr:glycoside hydrolase [Verrucomicrobiae bacterium]